MAIRDVVLFSVTAALAALFFDAALVHGLFWASDPGGTYWVVKACSLTAVFLAGTALRGVGFGPARNLCAIHAVLFAAYLQWFAPVGLPHEPEWLDFRRLWVIGLPIDFLATLGGYLLALWLRRRSRNDACTSREKSVFLRHTFFTTVLIVALDASLGQLFFRRDFPGVTLLLQHIVIGFVFLAIWLSAVGRSRIGWPVGGILLALVWLSFDLYFGVEGLPAGTPELRDYGRLWWPSYPIAVIAALLGLGATGRPVAARQGLALGGFALAMTLGAAWQDSAEADVPIRQQLWSAGLHASARASGDAYLVTGSDPSDAQGRFPISGKIRVAVVEKGDSETGAASPDSMDVQAQFHAGDDRYEVTIRKAMPWHPLGRHTTWSGVAYDRELHGDTGIGSSALPRMQPQIALWGWAEVMRNDELIARMAPTHLMVCRSGPFPGIMLQVDTEGRGLLTEPDGHLTAVWQSLDALTMPRDQIMTRYLTGSVALLVLVIGLAMIAVLDDPLARDSTGAERT